MKVSVHTVSAKNKREPMCRLRYSLHPKNFELPVQPGKPRLSVTQKASEIVQFLEKLGTKGSRQLATYARIKPDIPFTHKVHHTPRQVSSLDSPDKKLASVATHLPRPRLVWVRNELAPLKGVSKELTPRKATLPVSTEPVAVPQLPFRGRTTIFSKLGPLPPLERV